MRGDGATNPVFHIHWWICRRSPKVTVKFIFCWLYSLSKSLYFCYWGFLCVWVGYLESNVVLLEFQVRTCELRSGTGKIWTWQIFKKLLGFKLAGQSHPQVCWTWGNSIIFHPTLPAPSHCINTSFPTKLTPGIPSEIWESILRAKHLQNSLPFPVTIYSQILERWLSQITIISIL